MTSASNRVREVIRETEDALAKGLSSARATMARVVRETGPIAESPYTWAWATSDSSYVAEEPTNADKAAGIALRLWALHRRRVKHDVRPDEGEYLSPGMSFGRTGLADASLEMRLLGLSRARTEKELVRLLTNLVNNTNGQLNYPTLARDIEQWFDPNHRSAIAARWVRDAVINQKRELS